MHMWVFSKMRNEKQPNGIKFFISGEDINTSFFWELIFLVNKERGIHT